MNNPDDIYTSYQIFTHIRIIIGMILGISISRLVVGVSRFMQHPIPEKIYITHLCWVLFILFYIIHFWWFEFSLARIKTWSFSTYFFLIIYTGTIAVVAAILFPDKMGKYRGFRDYLQARRKSFYGVLLVLFILDVKDTHIKGADYYSFYGWGYSFKVILFITGTIIAIITPSQRYQLAFAIFVLAYQLIWSLHLFGISIY